MSVGSDSVGGQQAYCSNNDQARYRCARAPAFFFISHQNKAQTPNMGRSGKQLSPTAGNAFLYDEKVVLSCEGVHSEWRRDDEAERVGFCDATGGTVDGGTCPFVISNGYAGLFGTCGGRVASTPGSWTFITTDNGGLSPSYGRTNQHSQSPTGNFIYDEPVLVTCDCLHSEWCRWGEDEVLGTCDIENGLLDGGLNPLYIFAFGFNDGTYRVSPNSRGVKVIASGLQPGDEAKFRATDGTRKFQVVVEDGALYVCHRRGFSMILR